MQTIIKFFTNIEIKNRIFLSRHKFIYALIGGAGVILYWRGVWLTADIFYRAGINNSDQLWGWLLSVIFSGPGSVFVGALILSLTGLLVQEFIGNDIIISGLKKEKKIIDKTEDEIIEELKEEQKNKQLLQEIDSHLHDLESNKFCVIASDDIVNRQNKQ